MEGNKGDEALEIMSVWGTEKRQFGKGGVGCSI